MPRIIIIIDELADLMMSHQSEVEDAILSSPAPAGPCCRYSSGHCYTASIRQCHRNLIKANVPSDRLLSVSSGGVDSRTILDMNGAEENFSATAICCSTPTGPAETCRVQGAFVSENEIARVTDFIRAHLTSQPVYSGNH